MIKIDTSNWKTFTLSQIFEKIEPTKGTVTEDLLQGNEVPYIGATKSHNGFLNMVARKGNEEYISKGNCIVLVQIGAGGAGYATYQEKDFIGMAGKTCCAYSKHLTRTTGLFLATLLCKERFRYSYGRSWTGPRICNTQIKLPALKDGTPDWEQMNNIISAIIPAIPKTKNMNKSFILPNMSQWKEFVLGDIFPYITFGKIKQTQDLPEGNEVYYVGAKKTNNGIIQKYGYDSHLISKGNCLIFICDGQGSIGYNNYMDKDFYATINLALGYNDQLNKYNALFLVTLLDLERSRFSFGRKRKATLAHTKIKLPATKESNGTYTPDWKFMENYIKSLPYGDLI